MLGALELSHSENNHKIGNILGREEVKFELCVKLY